MTNEFAVPSASEEAFGFNIGPAILKNVHDHSKCADRSCVIHNPSDHHMRDWPLHWRGDTGVMERTCSHFIGHPDPDQPWPDDDGRWTHGCDGCCASK